MKYVIARFVSGLVSAVLIPIGILLILVEFSPLAPYCRVSVRFAILTGCFTLACGLFCLYRYRSWRARANRKQPEHSPLRHR